MSSNGERVSVAWEMLEIVAYNGKKNLKNADARQDAVVDALTNLRHMCILNNIDFEGCLNISEIHFEEETKE